jgi:hypothetical protein
MNTNIERLLELANNVEHFNLHHCGPSDDPDMQTAYLYAFKDLLKRFVVAARRIDDSDFRAELAAINLDPEFITDAYDVYGDLIPIIDLLREKAKEPGWGTSNGLRTEFIDSAIVARLASNGSHAFNLEKLVRFAVELNENYSRRNYLSCALLIRAIINHVPAIFDCRTFSQVVAGSGRSVKAILGQLEEGARDIGDLHTHEIIDGYSTPPTKHQIEPYKPAVEVLFKEIERRIGQNAG